MARCKWPGLVTSIFLGLLCCNAVGALAADVRLISSRLGHDPIGDPKCNLLIAGDIRSGDLKRVRHVFGAVRQDSDYAGFACLHSSGGSYQEALRIAKFFLEKGIGTLVRSGDRCFSACAIMFMAGTWSSDAGKSPSRLLHVRGRLGFHAPYLRLSTGTYDKRTIENSFKAGLSALTELIALEPGVPHLEFFPKQLIVEMVRREPDEAFLIDTVRKAIKFDVSLYGLAQPKRIERRMACIACGNLNSFHQFDGCVSEHDIKMVRKNQVVEFSVSVRTTEENATTCKLSAAADGGRYIGGTYSMGGQWGGYWGLWHLYPPDTLIRSLPALR